MWSLRSRSDSCSEQNCSASPSQQPGSGCTFACCGVARFESAESSLWPLFFHTCSWVRTTIGIASCYTRGRLDGQVIQQNPRANGCSGDHRQCEIRTGTQRVAGRLRSNGAIWSLTMRNPASGYGRSSYMTTGAFLTKKATCSRCYSNR